MYRNHTCGSADPVSQVYIRIYIPKRGCVVRWRSQLEEKPAGLAQPLKQLRVGDSIFGSSKCSFPFSWKHLLLALLGLPYPCSALSGCKSASNRAHAALLVPLPAGGRKRGAGVRRYTVLEHLWRPCAVPLPPESPASRAWRQSTGCHPAFTHLAGLDIASQPSHVRFSIPFRWCQTCCKSCLGIFPVVACCFLYCATTHQGAVLQGFWMSCP